MTYVAVSALALGVACGDDEEGGNLANTTLGTGGNGTAGSSSTNNGGNGAMMAGGNGGTPSTGGTGGTNPNYPAGPYGNEVGDTFPLLTWQGYLSTNPGDLANLEVWTDTYTSLDLHQSGASYALVHTTLST